MKAILTLLTLLSFTLVSASAFACGDHDETASTTGQTTIAQADEGTKKGDEAKDDKKDEDKKDEDGEKKKEGDKADEEPS